MNDACRTPWREDPLRRQSKDTDFRERSFVEGFPPKVIWLDLSNAGTAPIEAMLRREQKRIEIFAVATDASLLILSIGASAV